MLRAGLVCRSTQNRIRAFLTVFRTQKVDMAKHIPCTLTVKVRELHRQQNLEIV